MSAPLVRVAVVTGSNQGIGFAIVKGLAKEFQGAVYLTSRNVENGKKAVDELASQGLKVNFHQLDIDDQESINNLATYIKEKYGGLDLLINNAAMAYKVNDATPFSKQAEHTIRVNYFGTINLCNALFPLLRPHARVVNVSSRAGMLKFVKDPSWRDRFSSERATLEDIAKALREFVDLAQEGKNEPIATTAYGMSKVGLTAATRAQQRLFDQDKREDIIVNACCPGYVSTNMSSYKGKLTPDEGAITPIYLGLLPPNVSTPKGEFWAEKKPVDWTDLEWTWK